MTIWVWILTYTILGTNPEHHTIGKYQTQEECEQALRLTKEEKRSQNKMIVGSCKQTLRELRKSK